MTRIAAPLVLAALLAGCAAPEKRAERQAATSQRAVALQDLWAFDDDPRPLRRPVLLLAGWNDDPSVWAEFRRWLDRCATGTTGRVFAPDLRGDGGICGAAERLLTQFDGMGEVDVIAHSAGGLVAREAARAHRGDRRLKVVRLFTLNTPHEGSKWGKFHRIVPDGDCAADCRPDGDYLRELNADPSSSSMEIVTFWFRGDTVVKQASAEAFGDEHYVYARAQGVRIHQKSMADPRFIRDAIAGLRAD